MGNIDEELKANFQNDRQRFVANVIFTAGWMRNQFSESLKPFGLSLQQFNILRILRGAGGWMPMSRVKGLMVEKAPNATRLVDKLLDKNLLERQRSDSDRRVVFVRISKEGLALCAKVDQDEQAGQYDFIDRVSDKEASQASKALDKLRG